MANKLDVDGSPRQIAGWLKRTYPKKPDAPGLSTYTQANLNAIARHLNMSAKDAGLQHAS